DAVLDAVLVDGVDIVHPDRHPDAFRGFFPEALWVLMIGFPATTLAVSAEKNFCLVGDHRTEAGRVAPFEASLPAPFLEPLNALSKVRDVENRCHCVCEHFWIPPP